ncbi:MAG: helix-turn-helix domain-containing protein [Oscillospiraceae bacterium]|nr:helix-turn-helix domain-containing protein [Oscillospiraceae bacterium]
MTKKTKNASTVGGTTIEAKKTEVNCWLDNSFILRDDCTLDFRKSQEEDNYTFLDYLGRNQEKDDSILLDYLGIGAKNALTARQLAEMLGVRKRAISLEVERLRRKGFPICASGAAGEAGYFLPADIKELSDYCLSLAARLKNIHATLAAVQETCERLSRAEG